MTIAESSYRRMQCCSHLQMSFIKSDRVKYKMTGKVSRQL